MGLVAPRAGSTTFSSETLRVGGGRKKRCEEYVGMKMEFIQIAIGKRKEKEEEIKEGKRGRKNEA